MEHIVDDLNLDTRHFDDDLSPTKFSPFALANALQMPDEFFSLGADSYEQPKGETKGYSKKILQFSELSESDEGPIPEDSESFSVYQNRSYEPNCYNEDPPKMATHALLKAPNQPKMLNSVQLDQESMISQASIHSPMTHNVDQKSGVLKPSPITPEIQATKCENTTEMNINQWKSHDKIGEVCEKPLEEDLIFLVRRIDKRTNKSVLLTKHRKRITKCPHKTQEYYAKGMCKNCYHNKGTRSKKATACEHKTRDHYAKGLCKNCYLHFFHIKKKARRESAETSTSGPKRI